MPFSRFFEELPLLRDNRDEQVGLCVMGPIGAGDTLIWMSAWAWQQDGDKITAASTGDAGTHVHGAHPLKEKDNPPFAAPEERWMVQTGFRQDSGEYDPEKPVLVQALALVENGDQRAMVQWSQAVRIKHGYQHPPGDDAGHEHGPE
jgi:hypothetical protein